MCDCLLYVPNWVPGLQLRHVTWLGIQLVILWFTGWCSIHWTTPARAGEVLHATSILAKLLSFAIIKGMGLQISMNISILSSFLTGGFYHLLTLNSKYLPTLVSCVKCVVCLHQDACCDFVIVCCLMRYYIGLAKKSILLFQ